jgi:fimbrial chaperone protein
LRAPRDLPDGELRSHLSVSTIPLVAPVTDTAQQDDQSGDNRTVEVRVGLEYRITIPVLLRTGNPQGGSSIAAAVIDTETEQRALKVTLARTGTRSDYGVVRVFDAGGEEIGLLRGIAVLPPAPTRTVRVPLQANRNPARITYSEDDVGGKKGAVLAEFTMP